MLITWCKTWSDLEAGYLRVTSSHLLQQSGIKCKVRSLPKILFHLNRAVTGTKSCVEKLAIRKFSTASPPLPSPFPIDNYSTGPHSSHSEVSCKFGFLSIHED